MAILNLGKVKLQGKSALVFDDEEALVWTTEGKVGSELWLFDFAQMKEATSNFSEENKLGQGGFGPVYKVIINLHAYPRIYNILLNLVCRYTSKLPLFSF